MHFDWFFHVVMTYWKTNAWVTSPLTIFASSLNKTNRFHVAVAIYVIVVSLAFSLLYYCFTFAN